MLSSSDEETREEERIRERWLRLVEWLKSEHNMDVGEGGLLVECRKAQGKLISSRSPSAALILSRTGAGVGLFAAKSCAVSAS